jgi:uncharacterized membrane protein
MKKISFPEKMLLASAFFIFVLLMIRLSITRQLMYFFYAWNLFLAFVPLLFSHWLKKQSAINIITCLVLLAWLLFLPNAPYVITDIFHFEKRPPVPQWLDLLIVTNAAWCGLLAGIISLLQVEQWLRQRFALLLVNGIISFSLMLCGYGVYLGRYGRFNSWDLLTAPQHLLYTSLKHLFHPLAHKPVWGFSMLFGVSLLLFYYTVRSMGKWIKDGK